MTQDPSVPASIAGRVLAEGFRQACFLLEEGCVPRQIDNALQQWGWAMGPFRATDRAVDRTTDRAMNRGDVAGPADREMSLLAGMLRAKGRRGTQGGAGWYLYTELAPQGLRDPEIEAMVVAHSATIGVRRREIPADEIVERCHLAMVNAAAGWVAAGDCRPADIDAACIRDGGFPAAKGGPLAQADLAGLPHTLERMGCYRPGHQGWMFEPAGLLLELAADGRGFASMNGAEPT